MDTKKQILFPFFKIVIWLLCAFIALGSYNAHNDIGFLPGLIVWSIFVVGILYFISWILKKILGITFSSLFADKNKQITLGLIALLITAFVGPFLIQSHERKIQLQNEAYAIHQEMLYFRSKWTKVRDFHHVNWTSSNSYLQFPYQPIYPKTGLYFLYGKDIYQFPPKLSEKLFIFYSAATQAESIREDLTPYVTRTTSPSTFSFSSDMNMEYDVMVDNIILAVNITGDGTLNMLDDVRNDWCPFDFC
jgi:hypothetical protein